MKSLGSVFIFACGILFLHGCARNQLPSPSDLPSLADLPFVHRIDIQQGNVITQEMIAQLEFGMDKKKVIFIMGSPIILDTFHADRWDYLYTFQHGRGEAKRRRVTLYFEDSQLARLEGDVKPALGKLIVDTRQDMTVDVPEITQEGLMAKIKGTIPFVGTENPHEKSTADSALVTLPDEEVPGVQTPLKPVSVLTPVERAALEEAGGSGVFAKMKEALPFSGDRESDRVVSGSATRTRAETSTGKPAPPELIAGAETVKTDDSQSLLTKLKGAMPFAKTKRAAEDPAFESDTSIDHRTADTSEGMTFEDTEREDVAEDSRARPEIATVSAPPPGAPTAIPLENQLLDTPTRTDTNRPGLDPDDYQDIDVPAQNALKKRGFFARLLGKDRPPEASSEPDREIRYRNISDPEIN